jgi:hypothetical protein
VNDDEGAMLRFSSLESARFGLRIFRSSPNFIDADRIAYEIERERIDVAILRVPSTATGDANALAKRGFAPILADTQVLYGIELETYRYGPVDASIVLRPATRDDAALLESMARSTFAGYVSHYHANPLFSRDKIVDGYAEWAARHIDGPDGAAAWLVERNGSPVAFSCYRIAAGGAAVGVLNGVLPTARRQGIYRGMLHRMLGHFAATGSARFEIATQTHNVIVQRVWAESGLSLQATHNTLHVNALRAHARKSVDSPVSPERS